MLDLITYTCAACAHEFPAEFQPGRCPKCGAKGGSRDFPSTVALTIARQNDRFRAALALVAPRLCQARLDLALDAGAALIPVATVAVLPDLNGRIVVTPGVAAKGIHFVREAIVGCAVDGNFTDFTDPYADHTFGTLDVQGERLYWQVDLYDADCVSGSPSPSDPAHTHRVVTIMFPIER